MTDFTPIKFEEPERKSYVATMPSFPLRPCINTYEPQGASYVWFKLVSDGEDLRLEECGDDANDIEEHVAMEFQESGFDSIIGSGSTWHSVEIDGQRFSEQWIRFALEEGLAPGQPFCVCFSKPHYSQHWTDCGYEYDCNIDWEIVARVPFKNPLKAWEKTLARMQRVRAQCIDYAKRLAAKRRSDRKSMYIARVPYSVSGVDHYYPDYPMSESGLSLSLRTFRQDLGTRRFNHVCGHHLADGRDDNGTREVAFSKLVENLSKTMPELADEAFLKSLPEYYGRW